MSFDSREFSIAQGIPVRLYRFHRGVTLWLYCTADRNIELGVQTFRSVLGGISDSGIQQTGDAKSDGLTITAPASLDVVQPFRAFPPSDPIGLSVFDMHYGDTEARLAGSYRISSVGFPALDRCKIKCVTRDSEMGEPGLLDAYMRTCTAVLGDRRCKVDLESYRVDLSIDSRNGLSVFSSDLSDYPAGWFTGGYVAWAVGGGEFDRRFIDRHISNELQLLGGTVGIPPAAQLRAYPGCDFLASTCHSKFGNSLNNRGIPHLQLDSPFDGNQVW
ncbi:MAG: hypothetical protein CVV07_01025 [Gammaproteobacteria bacterium HGW-Gammaproteobacteria-11]|nr:MAG: hypothetical protein CVV07_01025 [Gammaproteobacteria bacterium HGW-Gammaproteobacteria-11]